MSGWKILVKVIETSIKASVDESIKERDRSQFLKGLNTSLLERKLSVKVIFMG